MIHITKSKAKKLHTKNVPVYVAHNGVNVSGISDCWVVPNEHSQSFDRFVALFANDVKYYVVPRTVLIGYNGQAFVVKDTSNEVIDRVKGLGRLVTYLNARYYAVKNRGYISPDYRNQLTF